MELNFTMFAITNQDVIIFSKQQITKRKVRYPFPFIKYDLFIMFSNSISQSKWIVKSMQQSKSVQKQWTKNNKQCNDG